MRQNDDMNAPRPLRLFVLALLLSLVACATERGAKNLMSSALYDYSAAIRWNDFAGAATFLDPEALVRHPVTALDMKRYEQIQVTGYYVKGTEQASEHELRQLVEINVRKLAEIAAKDSEYKMAEEFLYAGAEFQVPAKLR